ncbi:MAG TPA: hypothetical protein VFJ30_06970 [Phycisphaerae bacterium]|nr:hypothetical protein [Phycisphaerae bacterium]
MGPRKTEETAESIASMDRRSLIEAIMQVDCGFPIDLTAETLAQFSDERLRHIYMALRMHSLEPARSH